MKAGASFVALIFQEHFSSEVIPATVLVTAVALLSANVMTFVPPQTDWAYLQLINASSTLVAESEHHQATALPDVYGISATADPLAFENLAGQFVTLALALFASSAVLVAKLKQHFPFSAALYVVP